MDIARIRWALAILSSLESNMLALAHIHKTAGITINRILRRSYGVHHCDVNRWFPKGDYFDGFYSAADHKLTRRLYPHLESIAGHEVKPYSDLQTIVSDVRFFTFLREPLGRTASHFQYMVQRMNYHNTFAVFCQDKRMHDLMTKHFVGCADPDAAIKMLKGMFFVGLIEYFDESIVMFREKVFDPRLDIRYRRQNVAPKSSIKRQLLDDYKMRSKLEEMNRNDLKIYRYVVEELYPQQKKQFGARLDIAVEEFQRANTSLPFRWTELGNRIKRNVVYRTAQILARKLPHKTQ